VGRAHQTVGHQWVLQPVGNNHPKAAQDPYKWRKQAVAQPNITGMELRGHALKLNGKARLDQAHERGSPKQDAKQAQTDTPVAMISLGSVVLRMIMDQFADARRNIGAKSRAIRLCVGKLRRPI
jgi:hypothetical protein